MLRSSPKFFCRWAYIYVKNKWFFMIHLKPSPYTVKHRYKLSKRENWPKEEWIPVGCVLTVAMAATVKTLLSFAVGNNRLAPPLWDWRPQEILNSPLKRCNRRFFLTRMKLFHFHWTNDPDESAWTFQLSFLLRARLHWCCDVDNNITQD